MVELNTLNTKIQSNLLLAENSLKQGDVQLATKHIQNVRQLIEKLNILVQSQTLNSL